MAVRHLLFVVLVAAVLLTAHAQAPKTAAQKAAQAPGSKSIKEALTQQYYESDEPDGKYDKYYQYSGYSDISEGTRACFQAASTCPGWSQMLGVNQPMQAIERVSFTCCDGKTGKPSHDNQELLKPLKRSITVGNCDFSFNSASLEPVQVNDNTFLLGGFTGVCYVNDKHNHCKGPACDDLVLNVNGMVYRLDRVISSTKAARPVKPECLAPEMEDPSAPRKPGVLSLDRLDTPLASQRSLVNPIVADWLSPDEKVLIKSNKPSKRSAKPAGAQEPSIMDVVTMGDVSTADASSISGIDEIMYVSTAYVLSGPMTITSSNGKAKYSSGWFEYVDKIDTLDFWEGAIDTTIVEPYQMKLDLYEDGAPYSPPHYTKHTDHTHNTDYTSTDDKASSSNAQA